MHVYTVPFCLCYEQQNVAATARAHEHSLFGASPPKNKMNAARAEKISRYFAKYVLYRKLIAERTASKTLNVFRVDGVDNSSRP